MKARLFTTFASSLVLLCASANSMAAGGWSYQQVADALEAVIAADRAVYTKEVVNRLHDKEKVIKASEQWKDDKALPLPAQMLRMGSENVAERNTRFSYALLSLWPINKQNAAKTAVEKEGLEAVSKTGKPFYKEEVLGGKKYFTAIYADNAISRACITCHNEHKDSPRTDFKMKETMGALVIRIAQ